MLTKLLSSNIFGSLSDTEFLIHIGDRAPRDAAGEDARFILTAEAGGGVISLIPQQVNILVRSDGLLGSASAAAFVARGFSVHYGGEDGQVSFDHMPNAGLEEVADRIAGRKHDYDAIVLFLQLNGLHNIDGDDEGEPEIFRPALIQLMQKLSGCKHMMFIYLGAHAGIPHQGGASRHRLETLLDACVEVFVGLGFLSSRARVFADQCTLTKRRSVK